VTATYACSVRLLVLAAHLLTPALPSSAGETHRVLMKGIDYDPTEVRMHVGDSIEWFNQDIVAHTATAKDRSFDVNVSPGRSGGKVMKSAGTFTYICRYHPAMTGRIVVEP
jgi:plastocyanin